MKKNTILFVCKLAIYYQILIRVTIFEDVIGSEVKKNQFAIKCLFVVGREGWRKGWSNTFSPVDYFEMDTGVLVLKF